MPKRETFDCQKCGNKNPMPGKNAKSATCINCGAAHAIVDDEGNRALVLYFVQANPQAANSEAAASDETAAQFNVE